MSDISLRFDGLVLGAFLGLAALVYLMLALGFALGALGSATRRGYLARVARASGAFAVIAMIGVALTAASMDRAAAMTGPDWIDWLTVPALVLFALGCWRLIRLRPH
jgi:hypothetical protein